MKSPQESNALSESNAFLLLGLYERVLKIPDCQFVLLKDYEKRYDLCGSCL